MRKTVFGLLTGVAMVLACGDTPFAPTVDNVSGVYQLQTFLTATDTGNTDWKAAGATLAITLVTNGVTIGHLSIPGGGTGGADFDADMAGLWQLSGDTVIFEQGDDSFVRHMQFLARANRLVGDQTFGDVRVQISLIK